MESAEDRRRILRVFLDAPLGAKVAATRVTLRDISAQGARIEHDFPLIRGKNILLEFSCDGERVEVECSVVRCKFEQRNGEVVYSSGLRFADPKHHSMTTLREILARFISRDFEARKEHMLKIKK